MAGIGFSAGRANDGRGPSPTRTEGCPSAWTAAASSPKHSEYEGGGLRWKPPAGAGSADSQARIAASAAVVSGAARARRSDVGEAGRGPASGSSAAASVPAAWPAGTPSRVALTSTSRGMNAARKGWAAACSANDMELAAWHDSSTTPLGCARAVMAAPPVVAAPPVMAARAGARCVVMSSSFVDDAKPLGACAFRAAGREPRWELPLAASWEAAPDSATPSSSARGAAQLSTASSSRRGRRSWAASGRGLAAAASLTCARSADRRGLTSSTAAADRAAGCADARAGGGGAQAGLRAGRPGGGSRPQVRRRILASAAAAAAAAAVAGALAFCSAVAKTRSNSLSAAAAEGRRGLCTSRARCARSPASSFCSSDIIWECASSSRTLSSACSPRARARSSPTSASSCRRRSRSAVPACTVAARWPAATAPLCASVW